MPKLALLHDHVEKNNNNNNARMGVLMGVTFVYKWFKILLHNEFSENLT